jgi:hypothetical protein
MVKFNRLNRLAMKREGRGEVNLLNSALLTGKW